MLSDIQRQSRIKNKVAEISGVLCYHKGCFFQYIEGTKSALLDLQTKLNNDKRHHRVQYLAFDRLPSRRFQSWEMRFVVTDDLPISITQVTHFDRLIAFDTMHQNPLTWENFIESLVTLEEKRNAPSYSFTSLLSHLTKITKRF